MLTIYTRPVVHMSRKHMACSMLVQVGRIDGYGYDGQQEDTICDVHGPWQTIQSTFKPVFRWFWLIGYTYELLKCLDLETWQFSWWPQMDRRTDRQTDYFTPVHVGRVMMNEDDIAVNYEWLLSLCA